MLSARKGLNPQTLISSSGSGIYMPMTTFSIGTKIQFLKKQKDEKKFNLFNFTYIPSFCRV
jgi:hypothetical protein